ncbi:Uncharacterised protein [Corynebacterium imitans]|uniref:Uncharacterized protein n=1 Tax=Corynebacterium imitans TaxID=156978 RepID=A0A240APT8_9CORY|nr:Uncharacterised protein [Corynebacterium imitans]
MAICMFKRWRAPPPQQDPTFTQIVNIAATVKHENHC